MYAILGAGLIGALAYTFTDSFWFSAVEGEVYAMSSCFTAMVFWCILKWERATVHQERWIIFTFYLIGLSIGVHLLCLLAVPAVVFMYYFKTYPDGIKSPFLAKLLSFITKDAKAQGAIVTGIIAVILLGSIQSLVIPGIVKLAFYFEIFFVNTMNLPFQSGVLIYGLVMLLLIAFGLVFTCKRNLPGWNTAILAFTMLIIGYSSFFIPVIRSNAHTPMNENCPDNAVTLHAYLGRQQYGDWPLLYGQYYNSPLDAKTPYKDGDPVYSKDEKTGKYIITNAMKGQVYNYDSKFCTFFPRMWDGGEGHPQGYRNWGGISFDSIDFTDTKGNKELLPKPVFLDNLRFFVRYQVNFMFWRYFMWNFCGRQNDYQGYDDADNLHGNWITGIPFLDALRYPQHNVPAEIASNNKGRNVMFGLPLLLGLLGFAYQFQRDKKNTLVITVLFFFTGLAIILYLNQVPYQPRERDYSYVGAFYAFAIWIGLGVLGIYEWLTKLLAKNTNNEKTLALASTVLALIVPVVMAHAEWDDHDRSGHYTCRDMAINYLESCAPNAILFTSGDNDTFPLWYAQEVEGIRTDVRVCNLNLLASAWYIDQMKCKAYNSAPLPFSLTHSQYEDGTRETTPIYENKKLEGYVDLKQMMDSIKSDNPANQVTMQSGEKLNYFPTHKFELKVNKEEVLKSGAVPKWLADSISSAIDWTMPGDYLSKNTLMVLDLLANCDWKRPIYFTVTTGSDAYMGMEKYLQLEGLTYRLVPLAATSTNSIQGTRVATDIMYNNVMNKFQWGNMHSKIYLNEDIRSMANDLRIQIGTFASALIKEGKKDSALKVLDRCMDSIPEASCPYAGPMVMIDYDYYQIGQFEKANALAKKLFDNAENKLLYFNSLAQQSKGYYKDEVEQTELILERMDYIARTYLQVDLAKDFDSRIEKLQKAGILN
jgi:Co/Zn/Cd efflux system component